MPSTILDTPQQIELFRLLQWKYCLKIEIRTGLRHSRGSILGAVNHHFGWSHRTKQAALDALDKVIAEKEKALLGDPA